MTHRWEARSLKEHLHNPQNQAMMGIVHGGIDRDLRALSAEYTRLYRLIHRCEEVGGNREEMLDLLRFLMPLLRHDTIPSRPVHLLGIVMRSQYVRVYHSVSIRSIRVIRLVLLVTV